MLHACVGLIPVVAETFPVMIAAFLKEFLQMLENNLGTAVVCTDSFSAIPVVAEKAALYLHQT
jgi:hypothetical protein